MNLVDVQGPGYGGESTARNFAGRHQNTSHQMEPGRLVQCQQSSKKLLVTIILLEIEANLYEHSLLKVRENVFSYMVIFQIKYLDKDGI